MKLRMFAACLPAVLGIPLLATPAHGPTSLHVCVGADRVLRSTVEDSCPAGQVSYDLALDVDQSSPPDEDKAPSKELVELKKTVDFLQDRVGELQKELASEADAKDHPSHVVAAPFHVVDHAGHPIFTVTDGSYSQAPGRVRIAHGTADNYGMFVTTAGGTIAASILATNQGAGGLIVNDETGKRRIVANGGGELGVFSPGGSEVGSIGLNGADPEAGVLKVAGIFQVRDKAGATMVEAGKTAQGRGVVRVGPGANCSPYAGLRVPDCILGHP